VDNDGRLDLFVTCPDTGNALFRNNGDGTFTDVAAKAGVALNGRHCLGCAFADMDGDGRQDLFVTCYQSQASALFRNQGDGTFRDVTAGAGLGRKASSVGCVFADVFSRGALDLFVTTDSWLSGANYTEAELRKQGHTVEPNLLYRADGKGRFAPADAAPLPHKALSHDAVIEDLDHDGHAEIYVGVDAIPSGNRFATHKGGNPLWTRPDGKAWREVSKEWGVGHEANCVCVPAADFDNDGDLDLLLVNFYTNVVLYRNETNDNNWLRVQARGSKGNRDGIGAKVALRTGDGALIGTRHIQAGSGYCRCGPAEAHFGLGRPAARYALEVVFPGSGRVVRVQDIRPGRTHVVTEP
jgi:enediyne biosynthesis protein E4